MSTFEYRNGVPVFVQCCQYQQNLLTHFANIATSFGLRSSFGNNFSILFRNTDCKKRLCSSVCSFFLLDRKFGPKTDNYPSKLPKFYASVYEFYIVASPKAEQRAESETGYWSKFLGKVPDYFKGPDSSNEVQPSSPIDAISAGEIQNDDSSSYQNQADKWQNNFKQCVQSNMASPSSSSQGSSSSGSQYGMPSQISSGYDYTKLQESMEKCRSEMSAQIPSGASSQNYFQNFQIPSGLQNVGSSFMGSSGSSTSGGSNNA